MKQFIFSLFLLFLFSCEKEEFVYDYQELDKLLISVTRSGSDFDFRTEFNYDSHNRIVEVKNILPSEQITVETYSYDEEGRIIEKKIDNYVTTYTYSSEGQLLEQNIHYTSKQNDSEWNEKTEFKYKNGKINKGIVYSEEGEVLQYISYKYDSRGNTLEKIVRVSAKDSDFSLVEIKFKYDSKVNPFLSSGVNMLNGYTFTQDADIKQVNNPVYSSYSNMVMSSIPPEYEISYEYNSEGLPVKAVLKNVRFSDQDPVNVLYEYRDIN